MSALDPLTEKMRSDYEYLVARLERIDPPEGHGWCREIEPHEWSIDALRARVLLYGPRITLRRRTFDLAPTGRSALEIRVNWNGAPGQAHGSSTVRAYVRSGSGACDGVDPSDHERSAVRSLVAPDAQTLLFLLAQLVAPAVAALRHRLTQRHRAD